MDVKVLLIVLVIQCVSSAYLNKKSCTDDDRTLQVVNYVVSDPLLNSPDVFLFFFVLSMLLALLAITASSGCAYVNPKKCDIHNVKLDPCLDSPAFCVITREEPYTIAFDFTPHFDARNLKVSMLSDPDNSTRFTKTVTPVSDACEYTKCPVENNLRSVFELDFEYYMKSQGQFPLQLRLWHDEDESDTCCFTFDVKMLN